MLTLLGLLFASVTMTVGQCEPVVSATGGRIRKNLTADGGTAFKDAHLLASDRSIPEQMRRYWTNFARTGDPNGEGLPL